MFIDQTNQIKVTDNLLCSRNPCVYNKSFSSTSYYGKFGPLALLLETIIAVGLRYTVVPYTHNNESLSTGDEILEKLRNDEVDVTTPDYAIRLERLRGLTLASVPVYCDYIGFMVNQKLIQSSTFLRWYEVFSPFLWLLVGLWRLYVLLVQPARQRSGYAGSIMIFLHVVMLSFFVKLLFGKALLMSSVSLGGQPFMTLESAMNAGLEKSYTVVFDSYVPGDIDQRNYLPGRIVVAKNKREVLNRVSASPDVFTFDDFNRLFYDYGKLQDSRGVFVYKGKQMSFSYSFCKNRVLASRIATGFSRLNECGLTYARQRLNMEGRKRIKPPITMRSVPYLTTGSLFTSNLVVLTAELAVSRASAFLNNLSKQTDWYICI